MSRRIALIATLFTLVLAPVAAAQQNPFGPLPQPAPTVTAVPTPTATPSSDSGTGRNTLFLIGAVLVLGFGIMGWFIARDARRGLPESELAAVGRQRDQGPHKHKLQAKAKAREKGRAQRAARKRNR
jgi:hypothetical protein